MYIDNSGSDEMVHIVVEVSRPSTDEIACYDRAQRYHMLRANAVQRRDELVEWLKSQGLSGEILHMGDANAFNKVFITSTPRVAEVIKQAPGVVRVFKDTEFRNSLTHQS